MTCLYEKIMDETTALKDFTIEAHTKKVVKIYELLTKASI